MQIMNSLRLCQAGQIGLLVLGRSCSNINIEAYITYMCMSVLCITHLSIKCGLMNGIIALQSPSGVKATRYKAWLALAAAATAALTSGGVRVAPPQSALVPQPLPRPLQGQPD